MHLRDSQLSQPLLPQARLAKARNEGSHADVPRPAQHPHLGALFGVAQSLPTALLVLGSITQLQNTRVNRCGVAYTLALSEQRLNPMCLLCRHLLLLS